MVTGNYEVIKSINTSLVLDAIRMYKEVSRSDLARITGLTTGTITNITNKLLELGLIKESGSSTLGTGGRKPVLIKFNDEGAYAIAVDIRTSSIEVRLVDLSAKTVDTIKKIGLFSMEDGINVILDAVKSFQQLEYIGDKLLGIGISLPGWLDFQTGRIIKLPNMVGWDNYPIKQELESKLQLPVFIENDANLSALGELWFGKGKAFHHMIYVLVEDGIGTGLILNQQIYRGNGIGVGELGHLSVASKNRICSCGNTGCIDSMSSAKAMIERYKETSQKEISFTEFLDLINSNDKVAIKLMEEAAENLGLGISILVNLFHPEAIVFGGKIIEGMPNFLTLVKQTVYQKSLTPMLQNMVILSSDLKENTSLLGAVALVFQSTLQPYSLNYKK